MGRKKRKRSNAQKAKAIVAKPKGFQVPDKLDKVAEQYYDKYQVNKGASTSSSGNSWGSGITSWTSKKKSCKHWQVPFKLTDSIIIHASAYRDHPSKDWHYPKIGLYFATSWDDFSPKSSIREYTTYSANWAGPVQPVAKPEPKDVGEVELCHVDWPDMSLPENTDFAIEAFEYVLNKAGEGNFVEIGCIGGHGRTGTALAAMQIMLGEDNANKAMNRVWNEYCEEAIESKKQEDWLWELADKLYPDTAPTIRKAFEKAEKEKEKDKSIPLVQGLKNESQPKQHSGTTQEIDDWDEEEFWMDQACEEYYGLIKSMGHDEALNYVAAWYNIPQQDLFDYVAVYGEEQVEEQEQDSDKEDDEAVDYSDWSMVNEYVIRQNEGDSGDKTCGLCDEPRNVCQCFKGTQFDMGGVF